MMIRRIVYSDTEYAICQHRESLNADLLRTKAFALVVLEVGRNLQTGHCNEKKERDMIRDTKYSNKKLKYTCVIIPEISQRMMIAQDRTNG